MTTTEHHLPTDSDLVALLAPISAEQEAGRDLDGTVELNAFEMDVREPEEAVVEGVETEDTRDWRAIARTARTLLCASKDLRVAVQLTRALHRTRGLSGLCEGLLLVTALSRHYWPTVYPPLDPDDGDATARVNALRELASAPFIAQIRGGALATVPLLGPISVKDALASVTPGSAEATSGQALKALSGLGPDSLRTTLEQLATTCRELTHLIDFVRQQTGQVFSLQPLLGSEGERPGLLDLVARLFASALESVRSRESDAGAAHDDQTSADAPPSHKAPTARVGSDRIASRQDVIATLETLCAYYAQAEPASPVPLLLRRAQRLVPMDFLAIMQDLARDGLAQVNMVAGLEAPMSPSVDERTAMSPNDRMYASTTEGMGSMMDRDD